MNWEKCLLAVVCLGCVTGAAVTAPANPVITEPARIKNVPAYNRTGDDFVCTNQVNQTLFFYI
jgi:hypothetical protein